MAINKNSTLAEVRDEILRNKVIVDQNQEVIDKLVLQIDAYKKSINLEVAEKLKDYGIYLDNLLNVDLDRLSKDKDYLNSFIQYLRSTMDTYKEVVVNLLNG